MSLRKKLITIRYTVINMDISLKNLSLVRGVIVSLLFLISTAVTMVALENPTDKNDSYTDDISGATVNHTLIRDAGDLNPNTPFFAGFSSLTKNGVSDSDLDYIKDVIEVYILNNLKVEAATTSYVKDSFKYGDMKGLETKYSFRFGINGGDIHTALVSSNYVKKYVYITVINSNGDKVADKKFTVYPARY